MANILIVDDVLEVRKNIKRTLEKENHKVFEAENGIEGQKLLFSNNFDLVILDVFMPGKGGIATLVDIKNMPVKKIIITGATLSDSDAFNTLINHYDAKKIIYKPFKNKELIGAVNEVLAG